MELTQTEIDAFNQVQESVSKLRDEYATVCADILIAEKKLKELPLLPVPPEDLKLAIIEMFSESGKRHHVEIKKQIILLATNKKFNFHVGMNENYLLGKPMRFKEINESLYVKPMKANFCYPDLLTGGNVAFFDVAMSAVSSLLVTKMLTSIMTEITPEELGYIDLEPEQIGTDRKTRLAEIQATIDGLEILQDRRSKIGSSLNQLGIMVYEK